MVAARKVRKIVCVLVQESDPLESSSSLAGQVSGRRFTGRPSDLLPWADPYIARLVRNLQEEVRQEMG
jgi:hypothetical protein